jgi:hypothetical protein
MLNTTERKVAIRIILTGAGALLLFYAAAMLMNLIPVFAAPFIKTAFVLLMVVAISFTKIPTEISFLLCGLAGCILMGVPFYEYGRLLWNNFASQSIFVIIVCGALVALLGRSDLTNKLEKTSALSDPEEYRMLKREADVFCIFDRLQNFIEEREQRGVVLPAILLLLQNMLLFISSIIAASTFSAMRKKRQQRSRKNENYVNAGILCMCVSGCLIVFFVLKSPWWLFFSGFEKDLGIRLDLPVATLIYALLSFAHGYYLIRKGEFGNKATLEAEEAEISPAPDEQGNPFDQRNFIIYIGLIAAFLILLLPMADYYVKGSFYDPPETNDIVVAILLIVIFIILSATYILSRIMRKTLVSPQRKNTTKELRDLMQGTSNENVGIKSTVGVITLIVAILSLRDLLKSYIIQQSAPAHRAASAVHLNLLSSQGALALLLCFVVLAIVILIGFVLGSNFGAFSIGFIVFNLLAVHFSVLSDVALHRWLFEAIIIFSTYCNQRSPYSTNAANLSTYISKETAVIQNEAWKSESLFGLSAEKVQGIAAIACVGLSAVLTACGII